MFVIFVERSDARQEAVIRFVVLQKSVARVIHEDLLATPGEYYLPYRRVKAMIELFKAGRQSIEDDLHSGRPPAAVSEENVEEMGHLVMNELQCRSETSQRKCRYVMRPPKQFSFGISICSVCSWRRMPKCPIQNKGKFVRRRLVVFWSAPEDLLTRFSPRDETRVPHLVPESKSESH